MPDKISVQLENAINFIIRAIILFLPLFFLPWTEEFFEFNKQYLLVFSMVLALVFYLFRIISQKTITVKINPINLPILFFLLLSAVSAWLSIDRFSSFFGYYGRFSDAWFGLLSLVIMFFLLVSSSGLSGSREKIVNLLKLWLYSSLLSAVISLLSALGVFKAMGENKFNIVAADFFNPASSSIFCLGIFLASVIAALTNLLVGGQLSKLEKIIFSAGLAVCLAVSCLINFPLVWILLFLSSALVIVFFYFSHKSRNKILNIRLLVPAVILVLAGLFLIWPAANPAKLIFGRQAAKEASLTYGQTLNITKQTLQNNLIWGSGPGTFAFAFSSYRPAEFNNNSLWQIRFDKGGSQLLELLATAGLLPFLSYLLVVSLAVFLNALLLFKIFKNQSAAMEPEDLNLITTLLVVFSVTLIGQLFFFTNTCLNFLFWFSLGLSLAFWQLHNQTLFKEKIFNFDKKVGPFNWPLLSAVFLIFACLLLLIFMGKFYAAEIRSATGADREKSLLLAVKLNPYQSAYQVNLAKFYLNRVKSQAVLPSGARDNSFLQFNITKAIEMARLAARTAPASVVPRETLGMIYRDIRLLTSGSEPWAVESFKQAVKLEPSNPVLTTELAKAYLNSGDWDEAEKYFLRALELKTDYHEAKFGLAKVYLKNKKDNLALKLLNELAGQTADQEVYYELGRLLYNQGQTDKAIDRFNLVLSLSPKHSNAWYSLGIAYETKGDKQMALKCYRKVLELNPGNQELEKKIKNLSE